MRRFGIVGWKDTGKTTLLVGLLAELRSRGVSVSTVKHGHGFDPETDGADTWRHREAGADEVLIATPSRIAIMRELRGAPEPPLDALIARLSPVDLVLVEGFKQSIHPKIEMVGSGAALWPDDPSIVARAADRDPGPGPRWFPRDAYDALADLALAEARP